jgi:hypothetical protein
MEKENNMYKNKKPLSIRIIYWFTQVVFWLFMLVLVLAIGLNVAFLTEMLGDKMQLRTILPVEVSYTEKGSLEVFGQLQEVEFVEAIGKIHFINTNPDLAKWFGIAMLIIVIIGLYILVMFRRFIGNVYRGYIFEEFNIRMLKKMAYGLVAMWVFTIIYSPVYYYLIIKNIEFEHLEISSKFNTNGVILIIALMLWVLSHIFLTGVKLQKEQDLTV